MSEVVLDATAVLALLLDEAGGKVVEEHLPKAKISAVGLAEVAARLTDRGMPVEEIRSVLDALGVEIVPFDADMAYRSAALGSMLHSRPVSLGGRASLALGHIRGAAVVSADRRWADLNVGVKIEIVG